MAPPVKYLQSTANADNLYAMMYLNDIERFTKLLQDKKRDKIIKMMDDMNNEKSKLVRDKKSKEVTEFINQLKS